jgi:hypothetical protein
MTYSFRRLRASATTTHRGPFYTTLAVETGNDVSVVLEATRRLVSNLVDIGVVVDQRS